MSSVYTIPDTYPLVTLRLPLNLPNNVTMVELDHGDQSFAIIGDETFSLITSDLTIYNNLTSRAMIRGSVGGPKPLIFSMLQAEAMEAKDEKSSLAGEVQSDFSIDTMAELDAAVDVQEQMQDLDEAEEDYLSKIPVHPVTVPEYRSLGNQLAGSDVMIVQSHDPNLGHDKPIAHAISQDGKMSMTFSEHQYHSVTTGRTPEGKISYKISELWYDGTHKYESDISIHALVHLVSNLTTEQIELIRKLDEETERLNISVEPLNSEKKEDDADDSVAHQGASDMAPDSPEEVKEDMV